MELIYGNNKAEILKIVATKAKYQKVMLIYDCSTKEEDIKELGQAIKNLCIYNQLPASNLNTTEILNSYKILIFVCQASTFNSLTFLRDDFTCIFCPTDNALLPFFLSQSVYKKTDDFLILNKSVIDLSALSSIYFLKFYNFFENVINLKTSEVNLTYFNNITEKTIISEIENLPNNTFFVDIDLITKQNIPYKYLPFVNVILIDAFIVFISACNNKSLTLVDTYKSIKNDSELLNKFYFLLCNNGVLDIINLNHTYLKNTLLKVKELLLEIINTLPKLTNNEINQIVESIKNYSKSNDNLLSYLYLYNIFNY